MYNATSERYLMAKSNMMSRFRKIVLDSLTNYTPLMSKLLD